MASSPSASPGVNVSSALAARRQTISRQIASTNLVGLFNNDPVVTADYTAFVLSRYARGGRPAIIIGAVDNVVADCVSEASDEDGTVVDSSDDEGTLVDFLDTESQDTTGAQGPTDFANAIGDNAADDTASFSEAACVVEPHQTLILEHQVLQGCSLGAKQQDIAKEMSNEGQDGALAGVGSGSEERPRSRGRGIRGWVGKVVKAARALFKR